MIKALFLDLGGVILTNGWDRQARAKAISHFQLEEEPFNQRHAEFYDLHEMGKISLDDYLAQTVFWKPRSFSKEQFIRYMQEQSQPHREMIAFIEQIKQQYGLKIDALSNEGRELALYRIKTFKLKNFIDVFFISCFLGYRKPDPLIYSMALDISQLQPSEVIYIDDRDYLIAAGQQLGLYCIHHTSLESTKNQLCKILKG